MTRTNAPAPPAVVFWVVFGLTAILLIAWALDRSGDAATRGLGRFYAFVGLPFLGLGLLVFLLSKGTAVRLAAAAVAGVPLLFLALMLTRPLPSRHPSCVP